METLTILGVPGVWQVAIIAVVILLIFGGKKIPEMMKGLGSGIKEFKDAVKDDEKKPEERSNRSAESSDKTL